MADSFTITRALLAWSADHNAPRELVDGSTAEVAKAMEVPLWVTDSRNRRARIQAAVRVMQAAGSPIDYRALRQRFGCSKATIRRAIKGMHTVSIPKPVHRTPGNHNPEE